MNVRYRDQEHAVICIVIFRLQSQFEVVSGKMGPDWESCASVIKISDVHLNPVVITVEIGLLPDA